MAKSGIGKIAIRASVTPTGTDALTGLAKIKQTEQLSQTSIAIHPLTLWNGLMRAL
jgi:hypothetical protein